MQTTRVACRITMKSRCWCFLLDLQKIDKFTNGNSTMVHTSMFKTHTHCDSHMVPNRYQKQQYFNQLQQKFVPTTYQIICQLFKREQCQAVAEQTRKTEKISREICTRFPQCCGFALCCDLLKPKANHWIRHPQPHINKATFRIWIDTYRKSTVILV